MADEGMMRMFKSLEESGSVSSVSGEKVVISKEVFAEMCQLPSEGIVGFNNLPVKAVEDMSVIFSLTGVPSRLPSRNIGKSTALHPLKVLNTKFVHTYKLKNQASVPKIEGGTKPSGVKPVKVAGPKKKKEQLVEFERPNPVSEHCIEVLKAIHEQVEPLVTKFDEWKMFRTKTRADMVKDSCRTTVEIGGRASHPSILKNFNYAHHDLTSIHRLDGELKQARENYRGCQVQAGLPLEAPESLKQAQTLMESCIVPDMNANHQKLSDELNTLSSQMAEVVDYLKEIGSSKKREAVRKENCSER
ncbi:hypothetical protein F511_39613 [Dorcoceras hygrometricum]|uniref:Uncharacterized protein n=1 Tax=Dorcoceras hygrometricum TaxID=472368 RepID=A0A2Z7DGI8_9LAMI|nr:hypothetical protein F511_39613 [Dorcoceras hygrometricum]